MTVTIYLYISFSIYILIILLKTFIYIIYDNVILSPPPSPFLYIIYFFSFYLSNGTTKNKMYINTKEFYQTMYCSNTLVCYYSLFIIFFGYFENLLTDPYSFSILSGTLDILLFHPLTCPLYFFIIMTVPKLFI